MASLIKKRSLNNTPSNSVLVTANVVGLYLSIPHEFRLNVNKKTLDNKKRKFISTEDIFKMN